MRYLAYFCDLYLGEGETRLAVARYWNDEGQEWHACKKHLADVKRLNLDYKEFLDPGNIDLD